MKTLKTFVFLSIIAISVSGCANTVRGVGEDVQKAGETLQKCC